MFDKMKTILITGCNGLIGSKLTNKLLEDGYQVIGLSTGKSKIAQQQNFIFERVNITDHNRVSQIIEAYPIDTIIHLAAIAHLKGRKNITWDDFYKVNTEASINLYKMATAKNIDFFFASTVDVYGDIENNEEMTEDTRVCPKTDYAKSKYLTEKYLEKNINENINYLIARFAPVYGEDFKRDIYKRIYLKYPTIAFRIGKGIDYHFLSVNNLIDFIKKWLEDPSKINGIVNVCDSDLVNSLEFLNLEKKINNPKRIVSIPKVLLTVIYNISNTLMKLLPFNLFIKIKVNLGKLINPPNYSFDKMIKIYKPKWNLRRTIYNKD